MIIFKNGLQFAVKSINILKRFGQEQSGFNHYRNLKDKYYYGFQTIFMILGHPLTFDLEKV